MRHKRGVFRGPQKRARSTIVAAASIIEQPLQVCLTELERDEKRRGRKLVQQLIFEVLQHRGADQLAEQRAPARRDEVFVDELPGAYSLQRLGARLANTPRAHAEVQHRHQRCPLAALAVVRSGARDEGAKVWRERGVVEEAATEDAWLPRALPEELAAKVDAISGSIGQILAKLQLDLFLTS